MKFQNRLEKKAKEIAKYYEETKTQMGKEKEYEIITKLAEHLVEILRIQMLFTSAIYYTGSLIHLMEKLEFAEDKKVITKMKEEYERRVKEEFVVASSRNYQTGKKQFLQCNYAIEEKLD